MGTQVCQSRWVLKVKLHALRTRSFHLLRHVLPSMDLGATPLNAWVSSVAVVVVNTVAEEMRANSTRRGHHIAFLLGGAENENKKNNRTTVLRFGWGLS